MKLQNAVVKADTANIDSVVAGALISFHRHLTTTGWKGRENEAVSLFAFGHLVRECRPNSIFYDSAQIAIESAVPQVQKGGKSQVRKDLLIWPSPAMTCWNGDWNPTHFPLAIMEWKLLRPGKKRSGYTNGLFDYDVAWLRDLVRVAPQCIGYAVTVDITGYHLTCGRIVVEATDPSWLTL